MVRRQQISVSIPGMKSYYYLHYSHLSYCPQKAKILELLYEGTKIVEIDKSLSRDQHTIKKSISNPAMCQQREHMDVCHLLDK